MAEEVKKEVKKEKQDNVVFIGDKWDVVPLMKCELRQCGRFSV